MNTDYEECTETVPDTIHIYTARFTGAPIAVCRDCYFTSAYWECAHDLEHDCEVAE